MADDSLVGRCKSLIPRLPEGFAFSHATAAQLLGLPLPYRLDIPELHVALPAGHRAVDARGVVGHELQLSTADRAEAFGLPVTSPTRLFRDLAGRLWRAELVAFGDAILRNTIVETDADQLGGAARAARRYRGRRSALEAIPLLDAKAESWPESLLRVAIIDARLPAVVVNEDVHHNGRFIARPDLRFAAFPLVVEYEGSHHGTDSAQWRRDVARFEDLREAGYEYVRVTADDLPTFDTAIRRLRSALRRVSWR